MGFLTSLFGGQSNVWTILFALIIVIILIVIGVWALKMVFNASGSMVRGRKKRLALIDSLAIDTKHNLVLVRRDDVEHLLIMSNTGELVVETGIPVPQVNSASTNKTPPPVVSEATTQEASASRLGLSKILKVDENPPQPDKPKSNGRVDKVMPDSQVVQLRETNKEPNAKTTPSLRHTGLLKPISQMISIDNPTNLPPEETNTEDNSKASNADSAMNDAHQIDSKAMESIEEGAVSSNGSAKNRQPKDARGSDKANL